MFINVWENVLYEYEELKGVYNGFAKPEYPIKLNTDNIVSIYPFKKDKQIYVVETNIKGRVGGLLFLTLLMFPKNKTYFATRNELIKNGLLSKEE